MQTLDSLHYHEIQCGSHYFAMKNRQLRWPLEIGYLNEYWQARGLQGMLSKGSVRDPVEAW